MPLYEYQCGKCGQVVEVMQRISDEPLQRCDELGEDRPDCAGTGPLTKLMSRTSFVLKGDGWYITDYARKESGKKGKKGEGSGSGDGGSSAPSSGSSSDSGSSSSTSSTAAA